MTETIRIKRFNARPVIVPMNLPLQTSTGWNMSTGPTRCWRRG